MDDRFVSATAPEAEPLLRVSGLNISIKQSHPSRMVPVVQDVDFSLFAGKTLGLVGESGSGKSLTAMSIVRLLPRAIKVTGGKAELDGKDLMSLTERQMRPIRGGRIGMVFQDPTAALNPTLTIGEQIAETIRQHSKVSASQARAAALEWLQKVQIPSGERRMRQYPHELSGGMRQRVMLAIAFSCRPLVLIADEPTTALDVTVQEQILDLMGSIQKESGSAVLLITHDLGIVAERCDQVAVMYAGRIVETAPTRELFDSPKHPYTKALLASLLDWRRPRIAGPLPALAGQPPTPSDVGQGCPFAPRCPAVMEACWTVTPPVLTSGDGQRSVRCLLGEA
jgi:oligopeptide/dipeptide ABC transporter ATP-binding protein